MHLIVIFASEMGKMRIDIITAVPELLTGPFDHSMVKRAIEKGLASIHIHNLRDYATGKPKVLTTTLSVEAEGWYSWLNPSTGRFLF
jgi:hypothetical protein